jgi:hypothetical protein
VQHSRIGGAGRRQKEAFKRAEKELAAIRKIARCSLSNRTDPEYP